MFAHLPILIICKNMFKYTDSNVKKEFRVLKLSSLENFGFQSDYYNLGQKVTEQNPESNLAMKINGLIESFNFKNPIQFTVRFEP